VEAHGAEDAVHVGGEGAERAGGGDGGPAVAVEGGDGGGVVGRLFRAEHADEGFIDGASCGGPWGLDLDADIALSCGPDWGGGMVREEEGAGFEEAWGDEREGADPAAGAVRGHGDVFPVVAWARRMGFGGEADFAASGGGVAGVGAEEGRSGGGVRGEREESGASGELDERRSGRRILLGVACHGKGNLHNPCLATAQIPDG